MGTQMYTREYTIVYTRVYSLLLSSRYTMGLIYLVCRCFYPGYMLLDYSILAL